MSERYTRLFALEENLYSEGSPVVISAGALLKDNQTGAVLAQLKIRNIGDRRIKAAAVRIMCFDTLGKPLEGMVEKEYLDLDAGRSAEFGQKALISLPDVSARSFSVSVAWVAFSDNTVWNASGEVLSALPKPDALSKALGDEELVKQYRLKYGAAAKSFPQKHKDLWFCACGALNRADEEVCHVCGSRLAALLPFDAEALKAEKNDRLQKEAEERRKAEEEAKAAAEEKAARAKKAAQKAKKIAAIVIPTVCACIAFVLLLTHVIIPRQKYNKAMNLIDAGEYDSAYAMLSELGNTEAIVEDMYDRAMTAIDAEDYDSAYTLLEKIGNDEAIAESKYNRAMKRIDAQDYEAALTLLDGVEYKDSETQRINATYQYYKPALDSAAVGDTVIFGKYEQDNDTSNGKENIEWLVLAKRGNRLLVISQYALDCQQYNAHGKDVTWQSCTLRQWLNDDFLNTAFSDGEKAMIPTVTVSAGKNPDYSTNPGIATQDRVFLLSITEVNRYFKTDDARMCVPTVYAKANGADTSRNNTKGGAATCWLWLRSPGRDQDDAALVAASGWVDNGGDRVSWNNVGIRPAIWINISD